MNGITGQRQAHFAVAPIVELTGPSLFAGMTNTEAILTLCTARTQTVRMSTRAATVGGDSSALTIETGGAGRAQAIGDFGAAGILMDQRCARARHADIANGATARRHRR